MYSFPSTSQMREPRAERKTISGCTTRFSDDAPPGMCLRLLSNTRAERLRRSMSVSRGWACDRWQDDILCAKRGSSKADLDRSQHRPLTPVGGGEHGAI